MPHVVPHWKAHFMESIFKKFLTIVFRFIALIQEATIISFRYSSTTFFLWISPSGRFIVSFIILFFFLFHQIGVHVDIFVSLHVPKRRWKHSLDYCLWAVCYEMLLFRLFYHFPPSSPHSSVCLQFFFFLVKIRSPTHSAEICFLILAFFFLSPTL